MPVDTEELLHAAEILVKEENVQINLKHSAAGGLVTGLTTAAGGIVLGPVGLLLGAVTGGVLSFVACKDSFKPLYEVIANDLTMSQRYQLAEHIRRALQNFDITDVIMLTSLIATNGSAKDIVMKVVTSYAQQELKLKLK